MTIDVELQIVSNVQTLPHPSQFREWISQALWKYVKNAELTIRIVDIDEMTELNESYRKKTGPTNVLAFSHDLDPNLEIDLELLGDIVICAPIIEQESIQQNKNLLAHWAHMVVHGALHLLGYDHQDEASTATMQQLEIEILNNLGYENPY